MLPSKQSVGAVVLGLLLACPAHAAVVLQGRVVDVGKPEASGGIDGATVQVFSASPRSRVAEGITDGNGEYSVRINTPASGKLLLFISKIGYFARPLVQEVVPSVRPQRTARLALESASAEYYQKVKENAIKAGPKELESFIPSILALPSKHKATVFEALRAGDAEVYSQFAKADKTFQAAQEIAAKLDPSSSVSVYANVGSPGTILLTGAVPSATEKDDLGIAVGKYSAIARVQNDLAIEPGVKSAKSKFSAAAFANRKVDAGKILGNIPPAAVKRER